MSTSEEVEYPCLSKIGIVDLRSMGYCHLMQQAILRLLEKSFKFLNEDGLEEQLDTSSEIAKQLDTITANTKLKTRRSQKEQPAEPWKTRAKAEKPTASQKDQYPWLDSTDPRHFMTDLEIFKHYVDLTDSALTQKQKDSFYNILMKYREAFSLRDEIGTCPNIEVKLELKDKSPFFIRPFPLSEDNKVLVDKEMRKGVLLGILKKGQSSYSSPIMLIPRKLGGTPRIVTDFRHLNSLDSIKERNIIWQ